MNVRFFHSAAAFDADGKPLPPVELVSISGDFMGKDEVVRAATEDDRRRFHPAYAEFRAEQAPKDAPAVAFLAPVQTFAGIDRTSVELPTTKSPPLGLNDILPAGASLGGIGTPPSPLAELDRALQATSPGQGAKAEEIE